MIKNVSFVPFQKDVFQLKDIEKIAPKTKGISEYRQQLFSGNVFFALMKSYRQIEILYRPQAGKLQGKSYFLCLNKKKCFAKGKCNVP